jgi:hypothetical protein
MELTKLVDEIAELKKQFLRNAKELFSKDIAAMFERLPELEFITWTQYSPYFNDGDECVFSVHDLQFKLKDEEVDEDLAEYGEYNDTWTLISHADDMTVESETRTRTIYDPNRSWYDKSPRKTETYEYRPLILYIEDDKVDLYHELTALENIMQSDVGQDLMYDMFGNHSRITVHRDRVEIDEVEHD